jgi:hypothetical protein
VGFASDGVSAGSSYAVLGEFAGGCLQNGGAALLRLAASTHVAMPVSSMMQ